MRSAVGQASNAEQNAQNTASGLGASANAIGSSLTPFLTQEMLNPTGYSQGDKSALLASSTGAAGGANSALMGEAQKEAATTRNGGAFGAVMDDAARQREKAAAGASEGIAAQNANLKQQQQQEGAAGLGKLYGTDTSGMLDAMGQQSRDIDAETDASKTGWLQDSLGVLNGIGNLAGGAGNLIKSLKQ